MNSCQAIQETLQNFSISSDNLLNKLQGNWNEIDLLKVKNYLEGKYSNDYMPSTTLNHVEDALPPETKFYYFSLRMFDTNNVCR